MSLSSLTPLSFSHSTISHHALTALSRLYFHALVLQAAVRPRQILSLRQHLCHRLHMHEALAELFNLTTLLCHNHG